MKAAFLKRFTLILAVLVFGCATNNVLADTAQTSQSSLYIPLIGITSVPEPLALPEGAGKVTYRYAVKNFLQELPLSDVKVVDNKCGDIKFTEGDDNKNSKLDYNETWRYVCTTEISETTQSIATVTGTTNNITASHKAYTTVVVGLKDPPPLISIVNITKIAYPLSLPIEGGDIAFTYKVTNPGTVALSDVSVVDDKCSAMSGKLGDTNGNNLLDIHEVWIYTCTAHLNQTTTNTVTVSAYANGLKAVDTATITVKVDIPGLPNAGGSFNLNINIKIIVWAILSGALAALIIFSILTKKRNPRKKK